MAISCLHGNSAEINTANLMFLSQLSSDRLAIFCDEANMPGKVMIADKIAKGKDRLKNITIEYNGENEPAQVHAKKLKVLHIRANWKNSSRK